MKPSVEVGMISLRKKHVQLAHVCVCNSKSHCDAHKQPDRKVVARPPACTVYWNHMARLVPKCEETNLCARTVELLELVHLDHSFFAFIPSRIGFNKATDAAVAALIRAQQYRAGPPNRVKVLQGFYRSYGQAVRLVQKALASRTQQLTDEVLLAVAVLSLCDSTSGLNHRAALAHASGVIAIFQARPSTYAASEMTRSIMYGTYEQTVTQPCALGVSSPFDEEQWRDLPPASVATLAPEISKLRWYSHRLNARLPRLIAKIRALRSRPPPLSPVDCHDVIELAISLQQLEAREAETKALHRVRVVKSKEASSHTIAPFSMEYKSVEEFGACVLYWQARLHVIRICSALMNIYPLDVLLKADVDQMNADKLRMVANIIMSWQFAHARPLFGAVTPVPLLVVWGALMDESEFRGQPVSVVREWILERMPFVSSLPSGTSQPRLEDLDEACELLAGGPLRGFMAAAYQAEKGKCWYAA